MQIDENYLPAHKMFYQPFYFGDIPNVVKLMWLASFMSHSAKALLFWIHNEWMINKC